MEGVSARHLDDVVLLRRLTLRHSARGAHVPCAGTLLRPLRSSRPLRFLFFFWTAGPNAREEDRQGARENARGAKDGESRGSDLLVTGGRDPLRDDWDHLRGGSGPPSG